MSTPPQTPANDRSRPKLSLAELDAMIYAAELAVIDRDQRIKDHARTLFTQVRDAATHGIGLAMTITTSLLVVGRTLTVARRNRYLAAMPTESASKPKQGHEAQGKFVWTQLASMLWPMLPERFRSRVSPATATFIMNVALPLVAPAIRRPPPTLATPHIDLDRYAGHWYEIARLPTRHESDCAASASATYIPVSNGLAVINRCIRPDGHEVLATGIAHIVDRNSNARLEVSFAPAWLRWLPWSWTDYWVLYVDAEYHTALVGTPDRRHLWLLSRTPQLPGIHYQYLIDYARAQGYDVAKLMLVRQE